LAYRLEFENYTFPESLTYNLFTFSSAVPSAKLPRAHGARVPRGYLGARRVEIRGLLKRNLQTGETLQEQLDDLRSALMDGPQTLYLPNDRHLRNVQKDDNGQDRYDNTWPEKVVDVSIDLITGDPFLYNDTEDSDLNNTVDASPEDVVIDNDDGNAPAAPELRLTVEAVGGALDDIPSTSIKGATEFSFANGGDTVNYACLNGDAMTVYVDQFGGLGATNFIGGIPTSKAPGIVSPTTGFPDTSNIGTNGQITPEPNICSYGILRSQDSRNGQISTQQSIVGKRELITAGVGNVCASWGIIGSSADLQFASDALMGTDGTRTGFSVSGATAGDPLSATAILMFKDINTGAGTIDVLEVKLIYSFQNAETLQEKTRVKVRVEMRNASAGTLSGIKFMYGINPNQGFTSGSTGQQFFSITDTTAVQVQSIVGGDIVGLGGYTQDTIVGWSGTTTEGVLCRNVDDIITAGAENVRAGAGTAASWYTGNALQSSTANYVTDTTWLNSLPTTGSVDYALFLLSPTYSIGAGATQVFEFYIFTRIDLEGADVELAATVENITTGEAFSLTGTVPDGTVIKVNSLDETVQIGDTDRMDLFDGLFPLLALGDNTIRVTEANEQITNLDVYWRNRWY
jgi:hypothetical protein